jgi:hypothetical protein
MAQTKDLDGRTAVQILRESQRSDQGESRQRETRGKDQIAVKVHGVDLGGEHYEEGHRSRK